VGNLVNCTLYLIALINPISKVFILSMLSKEASPHELRVVSVRSSAIALVILFVFAIAGNLILHIVFQVQLYSMRIAAGVVLFFIGIKALTKGVFFEVEGNVKLEEVSVVPLSSPMIAGPATITAAISLSAEYGLSLTCLALTIAVAINLSLMLLSRYIGGFLSRYNLMGPLIRITGLIVATIAVQMALIGIADWYKTLPPR